ncbi:MAG TPA: hypothetical protein VIV66_19680 [Pyrinomonadaceae bacterium]
MRMREMTAGTVMLFMALLQFSIGVLAATDPWNEWGAVPETGTGNFPERKPVFSIPEPPRLVQKDEALAAAYSDVMRILGSNNRCSSFFGGSRAAIDVFGSFMTTIRKDYLPSSVGLKMSGDYTNVLNAATQVKYRLFDKASLNSGGPFYRQRVANTGATISGVGSFPPNSREARVLMLLHELGHLMKGADGQWLLPDDGKKMADSIRNTQTVETACGEQIRYLTKQYSGGEVVQQNNFEQTVSPTATTSNHQ